jgi:hypothetical protein
MDHNAAAHQITGDPRSRRFDNACDLMAQGQGLTNEGGTVRAAGVVVQIAAADPAKLDPHGHFIRGRLRLGMLHHL